ncbi:MAG: hypothetical protein ACJ8J7_04450 [Sulfurifustaceae bacterium]
MATDKPPQAVSSAEKAIQSTTDRMSKATHQAIDTLSEYGTRAEERLRESSRLAGERATEYAEDLGNYVSKRPLMSLAMALGAGLLLGALLRGRS